MRSVLHRLRAQVPQHSPHLLGSFTYADIVMATGLQGISPVADRHLRLRPGTRQTWMRESLAAEFPDLLAWRDAIYEQHRALPRL
jgi:glutathione S-transferase